MAFQEAVSRLTVETVYRTQGADTAANETRQVDGAQAKLIETANKLTTATGRQEQALMAYVRATQTATQMSQQLVAANDNVAKGWQAANDNVQGATHSIIDAGAAVLATTGHLKLLAAAAYTISPTFRALANAGLAASVAAIGPAAASAAAVMVSALAPALAFLARITIPITVIVSAWKVLNATIELGAALLAKYGDAQRSLVSGVDDNLAKLTRFQEANLSAEQVQRATELGARLNEAQRILSEFSRVQLGLETPALALQAAWVRIVELIAAAVDKLNNIPSWMRSAILGAATGATFGSVVPGVGTLAGGFAGAVAGAVTDFTSDSRPAADTAASLAAARAAAFQRLAGGMGAQSTFANRFGNAINDLANPLKQDAAKAAAATVLEFDRLEKSLQRQAAAQEAEARAVGASVGEHARLRTEMRLQEAALQDIEKHGGNLDDYAERIKKLADRFAEAAQKAAELKLNSDIQFERSQIGRTSDEQQIASKLRAVYGDSYQQEMDGAIAQQMRLNQQLQFTHDLGADAFKGLISDLQQGKSLGEAFGNSMQNVLNKITNKLLDMAFNNVWNNAFGGVGGAGGIGGLGRGGLLGGSIIPGILHDGGLGRDAPSSGRLIHPAYFENAMRFHGGKAPWGPGEMPAIIKPEEEVLTTNDPRHRWNGGGSSKGGETFHYHDNRTYQDLTPDVWAKIEARDRAQKGQWINDAIRAMQQRRSDNPNLFSGGG